MFRLSTVVASRAAMASATRRALPAFATSARHYAIGKTALSAENDVVAKIDGKRQESLIGGGLKRIETQHKKAG
ncbi:hypothetical protein BGZ47_003146 [Haplosporangium gracile]|nr:hypothetical protein BGZ47_003146 [Haplosporangium gracile]